MNECINVEESWNILCVSEDGISNYAVASSQTRTWLSHSMLIIVVSKAQSGHWPECSSWPTVRDKLSATPWQAGTNVGHPLKTHPLRNATFTLKNEYSQSV